MCYIENQFNRLKPDGTHKPKIQINDSNGSHTNFIDISLEQLAAIKKLLKEV